GSLMERFAPASTSVPSNAVRELGYSAPCGASWRVSWLKLVAASDTWRASGRGGAHRRRRAPDAQVDRRTPGAERSPPPSPSDAAAIESESSAGNGLSSRPPSSAACTWTFSVGRPTEPAASPQKEENEGGLPSNALPLHPGSPSARATSSGMLRRTPV